MIQSLGLDLGHPYPGRSSPETDVVLSHAGYLAGPAAATHVMANYDSIRQEGNSRLAPAGVIVTVGDMVEVGVMTKVGKISGASVGSSGPMIGSVASGVGVAGDSVG
jgi:hypothetical protein